MTPDPDADHLAEMMLADHDVMRTILSETLQSAKNGQIKESGRTICNGRDIYGPEARHPTSVSLYACPFERGGSWHTHVTVEEIRRPHNSVTDVANVVFGNVDVIAVAGTQTAEAAVRPADVQAAQDDFRDALGADVGSAAGVSDAVRERRSRDPIEAARMFREARPSMFRTTETGYDGLDAMVDEHVPETIMPTAPSYGAAEAAMHAAQWRSPLWEEFTVIEREAEEPAGRLAKAANDKIPADVSTVAVSNALGVFFGGLASRAIWGE